MTQPADDFIFLLVCLFWLRFDGKNRNKTKKIIVNLRSFSALTRLFVLLFLNFIGSLRSPVAFIPVLVWLKSFLLLLRFGVDWKWRISNRCDVYFYELSSFIRCTHISNWLQPSDEHVFRYEKLSYRGQQENVGRPKKKKWIHTEDNHHRDDIVGHRTIHFIDQKIIILLIERVALGRLSFFTSSLLIFSSQKSIIRRSTKCVGGGNNSKLFCV